MATREENIKKINDALEKLSDEELDDVAGGSWPGDCKINDNEFPFQQNVFQNNSSTDSYVSERPRGSMHPHERSPIGGH